LYASPSIVRMIKSRRMRWAGHGTPNVWQYQQNTGKINNILFRIENVNLDF
jgi:hypothetical protein